MKKYIALAATAAIALAIGASAASAKTKACWVYLGPIGDHGWSYQHHQGLLAVEKELGDQVETAYVENVLNLTASVLSSASPGMAATSYSRRHSASWNRR